MKTLLLLLTALPLLCFGQYGGNLQAYKVQTASYGATQNALLSLPDDYTTTTQTYPLIIALHGHSEIGTTVQDLTKLTRQGLPMVISKGKKIEAVNPNDGKLYKFIVLAPQHHGWTTPPENIAYIIDDLPKKLRIDTNRIYITGYSAGGQGVIQAATYTQALTNKLAAFLPMSPSAPDDAVLKKFTFFSQKKPWAWLFSGASDPGNYTANAIRYNDSIYKYNNGQSKVTLYPGGHCCWSDIYNPDWHSTDLLMGSYGLNIYEFMLMSTRNPIPPEPIKYITIEHDAAKVFKMIIVDKDGTVTVLDSASVQRDGIKMTLK